MGSGGVFKVRILAGERRHCASFSFLCVTVRQSLNPFVSVSASAYVVYINVDGNVPSVSASVSAYLSISMLVEMFRLCLHLCLHICLYLC